jgi:N4-gp56 family major capsid protein
MTSTTPTHVLTSIPELWARKTLRTHKRAGFFGRFVGGEGSGAAIIQNTDLLNKPGDQVHVQITAPLAGAGVSGDTTALEGSEENLTTSELTVIPTLYRHGVRIYRRANKKSIIELRSEARMRLAEWGEEKMDDLRFASYVSSADINGGTSNYAPNLYIVGGGSDEDDVAAGDTLTVDALQEVKLALYEQQARPLRVDGDEMFALVTSPRSLHALKREAEYRDWVREAHVRGADNPMFKGAVAMIDGMVLYQHTNVPVANNAGSVPVASSIAFGAEAFIEGLDENVTWVEDTFDYDFEWGVAYSFAFQPRRALEQNSLQVLCASPNPF